jgi:hypothetical protein
MVIAMPNPNLADVGKRTGNAREAAANRGMRPGNRSAVTLTPDEVRKLERALGEKARAVVKALRAAGLVGAAKQAAKDRGATSPLGGQAV